MWRNSISHRQESQFGVLSSESGAPAPRPSELEIGGFNRYQNLVDRIPHMVWRTNATGDLDYVNHLWREYTGTVQPDFFDLEWKLFIHAEDFPALLAQWPRAIVQGEAFELEARIRRHDGTYRWHLIKGVGERNLQGAIIAWLGTCTDIHDRKIFERRLIEAQKSAEDSNRAKTQFLANVSHEFRTPLNAIIGFTEMMLDPDCLEEDRLNNLSIVRRNGQQLLKVINEVMDISKVGAGGLEVKMTETDMAALMANIKSLMGVVALNKGIRLDFSIRRGIPERVWCDPARLQQILLNIVGNAVKFTAVGGVHVTVEHFSEMDQRSVLRFTTQDTGVGIDESMVGEIFAPFTQADGSTTRPFGGTGLGLATARKNARTHGGDIWLEKSEPGKGSTFVVEVEAKLVDGTPWITRLSDVTDDTESNPDAVLGHELTGRRILLVEDTEDNQILMKCFLQNSGAEIDIACNGKEGLEMALGNEYDLILMDIQMPVLDGYEATSRLRHSGYKRPIIALTAHALTDERDRCLRVGCNAHLTKPITRRHLIDSIARLL